MRSQLRRGARFAAAMALAVLAIAVIEGTALPTQEPLGLDPDYQTSKLHKDHSRAWNRIERWNAKPPPEETISVSHLSGSFESHALFSLKYCAMTSNSFRFIVEPTTCSSKRLRTLRTHD